MGFGEQIEGDHISSPRQAFPVSSTCSRIGTGRRRIARPTESQLAAGGGGSSAAAYSPNATLTTLVDRYTGQSRILEGRYQTQSAQAVVVATLPPLLEVALRLEARIVSLEGLVAKKCVPENSSSPAPRNLSPALVFDVARSELQVEKQGHQVMVSLTAQERAVLRRLLTAPAHWFSIRSLADHLTAQVLLSPDAISPERSIMAIISQLRKKLNDDSHSLIRLNRRVGYAIFIADPRSE
jgi:Transcriptional regulatory protein, C terminal